MPPAGVIQKTMSEAGRCRSITLGKKVDSSRISSLVGTNFHKRSALGIQHTKDLMKHVILGLVMAHRFKISLRP